MQTADGRPSVLVLLLVGVLGGFLSGTFGVGGGIVLVPLLVTLAGFDQRRAGATSLLAILPTAVAGSVVYVAGGQVDFAAAGMIAAGALVGVIVGTRLLKHVSVFWLRWAFITLLVLAAARMLFIEPERGARLELTVWLVLGYVALGLVIGLASGLLGVGGGFIAVPALIGIFGISDLIAKGISLLVLIPTTLAGTVSNHRNRFIDLRAAVLVGSASAAAAIPGAFLALALPARLAAVLFAILILGISVQLAVKTVRDRRRG